MLTHLISVAEDLGLSVVWRKRAKRGGFHEGSRTIRLNPDQSDRVTISVLTHEIAHAVFGDTYTPYGPARAKQERRADEWAALYLITPERYAAAEERRGVHAAALAFELGVTIELVEGFQRLLQRHGDVTYVSARMGAGQWRHRSGVA
ncbi:Zn-dependent peptidase ImmA (M78 family) [Microbacterium resistens]|uniref:Zn-dependent peptidase ImmA (M78 family) n=1 Tax=Microbacterium resistens TaxID=156977 RepID=A0ABU1SE20_9MICO|nr:ImmA/IrrE family metallo-endopeptidase [Microbacterium resistens]MDR6867865.1 Zn-dependent peptidase ImmA (M78 family) [Microbacterium resistens]